MKQKIILNFTGNAIAVMAFDAIMDRLSDEKFTLLKLMRDSSYEFKNKKYSSRMLNHYENNGWVLADRNNPIGKRKFSLFGMLFLNLNVEFNGEINKDNLHAKNEYEVVKDQFSYAKKLSGDLITPFELICLIAISLHRIAFISYNMVDSNNDLIITFLPINKGHADFSANIFNYIGECSYNKNKSSMFKISNSPDEFFVRFVYYIDQIRSKIGANLLLPELYNNLRSKDVIYVNQSHRNMVANIDLFTLGEALMNRITDTTKRLVVDEDKNCYAVELKYLGNQNLIKKLVGDRKLERLVDVFKPDIQQ
jgi:hypothetical protein